MGQRYSVIKAVTKPLALAAMTACGLAAMSPAIAGPVINIDKDTFLWLGLYGRESFTAQEASAPGGSWSKDFATEEGRLLMYLQAMKFGEKGIISYELDIDTQNGSSGPTNVKVLDNYIQFEVNDYAKFWVGRFVPPCDRASMEAPAYTYAFDFPLMTAWQIAYSNIRDNTAAFWGQVEGGQYKYYFALSNGRRDQVNQSDDLKYWFRFSADFLDPEPGYYPSSSYDGAKKIANVGVSYSYQKDGAGNVGLAGPGIVTSKTFKEFAIDYRYEALDNILGGGGIIDSEGGWYDYDIDHATDTSGYLLQGHGYFVTAGYAFPKKFGIGKLEPVIGYEQFWRANTNAVGLQGKQQRFEAGLQYLIKGHDIRIDTFWYRLEQDAVGTTPSSGVNGIKMLFVLYL